MEIEYIQDPTLIQAKKVMLDILIVHDKICRKHNLTYWLDYGTLLGAVRHKGFIPWDDDIDVSMPRVDFDKYKMIVQSELPDDMFFQSPKTDKKVKRHLFRIRDKNSEIVRNFNEGIYRGVFIDIFPQDQLKSNRLFLENIVRYYFSIDPFKEQYASKKRKFFHYILSPLILLKPLVRFLKKQFIFDENGDIFSLNWELNVPARYRKKFCDELIELEFEGGLFYAPKEYEGVLTDLYSDYMKLPPEEDRIPRHHTEIIFKEGSKYA